MDENIKEEGNDITDDDTADTMESLTTKSHEKKTKRDDTRISEQDIKIGFSL
jgi:hypothetical protein